MTELIERAIDSWDLHSTQQITGATLVDSRVPKVTLGENERREDVSLADSDAG